MIRTAIVAAVVAAAFALAVPGAAEARMANPGLNSAAPTATQDVQYYRHGYNRRHYRYNRHRGYRHHARYRHCWNERVRVRTPGGYVVWRTHRRCSWR
ncbi:hypothetical protein [Pseudolabrys sp. Root1462]|jgi:hypothetical protein|uniref:hypothetical protein n=1 Tax=Pseudolabrys sp. Root1462 TaxID=1736466 RepID=UPI0012E3406C|nr:hypothetical protein [Pseudolabrys sp. Root1462]